jgi:hypothetical protein
MIELEGTWEEIAAHAAELAGRRVRLTVLAEDNGQRGRAVQPNETMLLAMQEAERIQEGMSPRPGGDSQAYIREARAGAMYGYEPTE